MLRVLAESLNFSGKQHAVIAISLLGICLYLYSLRNNVSTYRRFKRKGRTGWLGPFTAKPVHRLVAEAYNEIIKTEDKPFVLRWWARDWVILPPKYLTEIKDAGAKHLSFFQSISDAFYLHKSVGDLYASDRMANVVKKGLSPRLPLLTPSLVDDIDYAFRTEIGSAEQWKTFRAQDLFSRIAHKSAARVMIGGELARDEKFIKLCSDFVMSIFITALAICNLPLGPFREVLSGPLTFLHRKKLKRVEDILLPVVQRRMEREKVDRSEMGPLDCIQWTLDVSGSEPKDRDPVRITQELLHNLWAGTSSPGGLLLDMIFQMLLEPSYLEPLREEAASAVSQHGWSEQTFSKLILQDSYIREINRLYPTGSISTTRTVLGAPFQFSDGLTLPPGSRFAFPNEAILHDERNFPDPKQFDGFRFAHLQAEEVRESGKPSGKWNASTMGTTNLAFGYGTHTCPGRHFAIRLIKIIFTKLILEYDIEWDGEVKEKPAPMLVEGQFIPNLKQKILVRRRAGDGSAEKS